MTPSTLVLIVLLLVMGEIANAAPDNATLFRLCPPDEQMDLVVEPLHEHATHAGLTTELISNAAESRLRAAKLYGPQTASPILYVNVNALPPRQGSQHFPAYNIAVHYKRLFADPRIGHAGWLTTWSTGTTGRGDGSDIVSVLNGHLDEFLVQYLRVRDSEACKRLRNGGLPGYLKAICAEAPHFAMCRER